MDEFKRFMNNSLQTASFLEGCRTKNLITINNIGTALVKLRGSKGLTKEENKEITVVIEKLRSLRDSSKLRWQRELDDKKPLSKQVD